MTRRSRIGALEVAAQRLLLRKVEALQRRAGTEGEARAAAEAALRLRATLAAVPESAPGDHLDGERTFVLADPWSARLLAALCRRYGIEPLDDGRHGTMTVRAPRVFLDTVLAPEFDRVRDALGGLMGDLARRPTAAS